MNTLPLIFGQARDDAFGRGLGSFGLIGEIGPGFPYVVRKLASREDDGIDAAPELAARSLIEPLAPGCVYKVRSEAGPAQLLVALDRDSGRPVATGRGPARNCKIVGKPAGITRLPIDTNHAAESGSERILARQHVKEKAGGNGVLEAESPAPGQLYRRFLF